MYLQNIIKEVKFLHLYIKCEIVQKIKNTLEYHHNNIGLLLFYSLVKWIFYLVNRKRSRIYLKINVTGHLQKLIENIHFNSFKNQQNKVDSLILHISALGVLHLLFVYILVINLQKDKFTHKNDTSHFFLSMKDWNFSTSSPSMYSTVEILLYWLQQISKKGVSYHIKQMLQLIRFFYLTSFKWYVTVIWPVIPNLLKIHWKAEKIMKKNAIWVVFFSFFLRGLGDGEL